MTQPLRLETLKQDTLAFDYFNRLYVEAFPEDERMPVWLLMVRSKASFVDFLAIYDENTFVGFTYMITNGDLSFILYLAIDASLRGHGYGTRTLKALHDYKAGKRIILNIEAIDPTASNAEQRIKRKKFYLKNGYNETGIHTKDVGTTNELLSYNKVPITYAEYLDIFRRFVTPVFSVFVPLFIKRA